MSSSWVIWGCGWLCLVYQFHLSMSDLLIADYLDLEKDSSFRLTPKIIQLPVWISCGNLFVWVLGDSFLWVVMFNNITIILYRLYLCLYWRVIVLWITVTFNNITDFLYRLYRRSVYGVKSKGCMPIILTHVGCRLLFSINK